MKNLKPNLILLSIIFSVFYTQINAQKYDLLIKAGTVIDTKNSIHAQMDIAILDGKIAEINKDISKKKAKNIINAKGMLVTPGLIDIHGHVFNGTDKRGMYSNGFNSVAPDGFTFRSGVTTIVDAGSSGWKNFHEFKEQTIDHSKTRVLAFLNIVGSGMKGGAIEQNIDDMNSKLTAITAKKYTDYIVGIKLAHFEGYDWEPVERTVEAGNRANIPVMIDFGGSKPMLSLQTLYMDKLRPGDIYTHAFASLRSRGRIVNDKGLVEKYAVDAQKKGIIFDVGHGGGSFAFEQAIPAIKQGFKPNSISTDLHIGSMNGGMKDMLNIMSKFINMGMSIDEVIACATWNPAQYINKPELGNLSLGSPADIALLSLDQGEFGFVDTKGAKIKGDSKIECQLTLKDGNIVFDLNGISVPEWTEK